MVTKRAARRTTSPSASAGSEAVAASDALPGASQPAAMSGTPSVHIEMVDPTTLLVDVNVRLEARLDADFVASVRDLGVLVPVVAVRTADGALRVRFGHRRTLAAVQSGLPAVPVVVAGDEAAEDDEAGQVARLLGQWAENEHRTGLNTAERVGVVAQLSAFGVTPAQIAKRTRLPRRDVDAALTVAKDDLAAAATVRYDFLDLLQAGTVAEFSDDPDAVKALVAAAKTGQFDHVAQRLQDTRTERLARQAAADALRESGVTVIDRPEYGTKATRVGNLTDVPDAPDAESGSRTPLTPQSHAGCPGHAAYLVESWVATERPAADVDASDAAAESADGDAAPGEGDSEQDAESGDDEEPDDEEADDEGGRWEWTPVYVCTDPTGNGHHSLYGTVPAGKPKAEDMTDEQREAARAERRDVIDSNKAWASAETVRRDWLRGFLTRKTAPKGTATFLALALAHDAHLVADVAGNRLAADLLGLGRRARLRPPRRPRGRCGAGWRRQGHGARPGAGARGVRGAPRPDGLARPARRRHPLPDIPRRPRVRAVPGRGAGASVVVARPQNCWSRRTEGSGGSCGSRDLRPSGGTAGWLATPAGRSA